MSEIPYLRREERERLDAWGGKPQTAGDLNYLMTKLLNQYLGDSPRYADYNEVIGALECCKLEMYRRRVAEYENLKAKENGDVY